MATKNKDAKGGGAPSPATIKYVMAFARTSLGDGRDNVTSKDDTNGFELSYFGVRYATFHFEGSEMIVRFKRPATPTDPKDLEQHREWSEPGWIEWRAPVSRDPSPWLSAKIGMLVGRTMFEIKQAKA